MQCSGQQQEMLHSLGSLGCLVPNLWHLQELPKADWISHGEVGEPGGGFQEMLEIMELL